ncbi:MAG: hypothetical protein ACYDBJ_03210 [Aggregatilineales bacterium]
MLALTSTPLSLEMKLSPGAHQLYNIVQLAPKQTQKFYAEQMGYSDRRVRTFTSELVAVGLIERIQSTAQRTGWRPDVPPSAKCPNEANPAPKPEPLSNKVKTLIAFGVTPPMAQSLAGRYAVDTLNEGLRQARAASGVKNRPGWLVWWLRACPPDAQLKTDVESITIEVQETLPLPLCTEPGLVVTMIVSVPETGIMPDVPSDVLPLHGEIVVTDDNREVVLLAYAVERVTGTDVRLSATAQCTIQLLNQTGYTAEDVARCAVAFARNDWRGQKGERPTPELLLEQIATGRGEAVAVFPDSLLARLQAIRAYSSQTQTISALSELWSLDVQCTQLEQAQADFEHGPLAQAMRVREAFPTCAERPLSWVLMLNKFGALGSEVLIQKMRLIQFEIEETCECFTVSVPTESEKNYLEKAGLWKRIQEALMGYSGKVVDAVLTSDEALYESLAISG